MMKTRIAPIDRRRRPWLCVSVPGRLEAQLPLSFANGKTKVESGPYRRACYRFHETCSSSTTRGDFSRSQECLRPRGRLGGVVLSGTRR